MGGGVVTFAAEPVNSETTNDVWGVWGGTCRDEADDEAGGGALVMDYSHQRMSVSTKELLVGLGDAAKLTDKIQQLFNGHHINATEDRAVLHPALRAPACVCPLPPPPPHSVSEGPCGQCDGHSAALPPCIWVDETPHGTDAHVCGCGTCGSGETLKVDGVNVVPAVHGVLQHIEQFSSAVRTGGHVGVTGQPLTVRADVSACVRINPPFG